MPFDVRISKKADAELSGLSRSGDKKIAKRILEGLEHLAENPHTPRPGTDILQLEAVDPKMWRLRVGQYSILYAIDEKNRIVNVTMIIHRKKAYR
ncbi:MAG: type II toxin-antitoxin system RelE/ParE family toxin [Euryarchaeota archaeon]|nr:type II toxin-antitoxin system RelE/ParE family toxin [Euryarchaeota archaeon]